MEDILASIKRIIAEDSEAAVQRSPARGRRGPVAVPDTPAPEPAAPEPVAAEVASSAEAEAEPAHEPSDVLELTTPLPDGPEPAGLAPVTSEPEILEDAMPAAKPAAPSAAATPEPAPATAGGADAILSAPAEAASRTAFAALSQLQVRADAGKENTLEGLVADLLRPMLRDWLDRELPALVERLVDAEIKRVSGRG